MRHGIYVCEFRIYPEEYWLITEHNNFFDNNANSYIPDILFNHNNLECYADINNAIAKINIGLIRRLDYCNTIPQENGIILNGKVVKIIGDLTEFCNSDKILIYVLKLCVKHEYYDMICNLIFSLNDVNLELALSLKFAWIY